MVRTLLISRAAASSSELSSSRASNSWWKQARLLKRGREDRHRRGVGLDVLELVLLAFVQQLVARQPRLNWSSSSLRGRRPKISSQATSTKLGFLVNCSMGMPR